MAQIYNSNKQESKTGSNSSLTVNSSWKWFLQRGCVKDLKLKKKINLLRKLISKTQVMTNREHEITKLQLSLQSWTKSQIVLSHVKEKKR